jgi:hypothetical protein
MLDRGPLWATAALLGLMAIASFDTASPEDAWPLRLSSLMDIEWVWLSDGKKTIWNLTDHLRSGGVFQAMAHEYAQFPFELPPFGADGITPALIEICNLSPSCNIENNPYFVAAHVLARLERLSLSERQSIGIRMVSFMSQSQLSFRNLLWKKDPVALLLLALWYVQPGESVMVGRATGSSRDASHPSLS